MEGVRLEYICWVEQVSSTTGSDPVTNVSETRRRPVSFAVSSEGLQDVFLVQHVHWKPDMQRSVGFSHESLIYSDEILQPLERPYLTSLVPNCPPGKQSSQKPPLGLGRESTVTLVRWGREICSCSSVCAYVYTHICIYKRVKAYCTHMHTVCLCVCVCASENKLYSFTR